jgi:biopolymer transport protein ExbB/TolQ
MPFARNRVNVRFEARGDSARGVGVGGLTGQTSRDSWVRRGAHLAGHVAACFLLTGAAAPADSRPIFAFIRDQAALVAKRVLLWYDQTPPLERISWGGLAMSAAFGAVVFFGRLCRVRTRHVLPSRFVDRLMIRLRERKVDLANASDLCELNPCAAARIVRAALDRWGQSTSELERAVVLASRVERRRLWHGLGTLRTIAVLSPLLGLLGSLCSMSRALATATSLPPGPALSAALNPLIAGVGLAIVAFAAYDGLVARVEALVHALDCLGAATVDALARSKLADPTTGQLARRVNAERSQVGVRTPHRTPVEADDPSLPREG